MSSQLGALSSPSRGFCSATGYSFEIARAGEVGGCGRGIVDDGGVKMDRAIGRNKEPCFPRCPDFLAFGAVVADGSQGSDGARGSFRLISPC